MRVEQYLVVGLSQELRKPVRWTAASLGGCVSCLTALGSLSLLAGQRRLWEAVKRRKAMCKRKSWMSKVCEWAVRGWRGTLRVSHCRQASEPSVVQRYNLTGSLTLCRDLPPPGSYLAGPLWCCLAKCLSPPQTDT